MGVVNDVDCKFCGNTQDLEFSDLVEDKINPKFFDYKCSKCGRINRLTKRVDMFTDPSSIKKFVPKPMTIPQMNIDIPKSMLKTTDRAENDFEDINLGNIASDSPWRNVLTFLDDQKKKALEENMKKIEHEQEMEKYYKRAQRMARDPNYRERQVQKGCCHPADKTRINASGVKYCSVCEKTLGSVPRTFDYGYTPSDTMIDDLFEQFGPARGRPLEAKLGETNAIDAFTEYSAPIETDLMQYDDIVNDIFDQTRPKKGRKVKDNPFEYLGGADRIPFHDE